MISALGFIFQVKAGKMPHPTLCFPREATVRESPHNLLLWPPGDLRFSHKNKTTRWDYSFHVSSCLQYPIAHLQWIILLTLSLPEYWNSSSAGICTDNWLDKEFILESRPCSSLLLNLVYLTPIQKILIFNHLEHVLSLYPPLNNSNPEDSYICPSLSSTAYTSSLPLRTQIEADDPNPLNEKSFIFLYLPNSLEKNIFLSKEVK